MVTKTRNGFWNTSGGYELNLLVLAAAVAIASAAAGRLSLAALSSQPNRVLAER